MILEYCAKSWLKSRHITMTDLAKVTHRLKGLPSNDVDRLIKILNEVIELPQIKDFILLSITLDVYAENNLLPEPLLERVLDTGSTFTLHHELSLAILSSFDDQVTDTYHELLSYQSSVLDQLIDGSICDRFLRSLLAVILSIAVKAY